jgi:peptidoglycan/LPS O-acetylase OafA/YrhL
MQAPIVARPYYPTLDILRGLAISIVIFYHNFGTVSFFRFGWMGVDLFFVLSGFLITDLLLKTRDQKLYFRNFYIRRVLRIFPLYYLVLFLFFTLSPILFKEKGADSVFSYYQSNSTWFWTYFQNWLLVKKGPPPVPFLAHFWSLAIEEQFYLFWPIMIFFIRKSAMIKKLIIGLIALAIATRLAVWATYPHEVEKFYCSTFTRMDSLLMGSLLAVHLREGKEIPLKLIKIIFVSFAALIILSLSIFGNVRQDNLFFPTLGYTLAAAFFTSVVYLVLRNEALVKGWVHHLNVLRFAGKISYGMYVFHIPIYLVLCNLLSRVLTGSSQWLIGGPLLVSGLSVLLTIVASTISFYAVERPILTLKKHFP